MVPPASALQQALGCSQVVGRQDGQVRHPLPEREHLVGGVGELAAAADTWELTTLEQFGFIGPFDGQGWWLGQAVSVRVSLRMWVRECAKVSECCSGCADPRVG
jgi:hypothetical protein